MRLILLLVKYMQVEQEDRGINHVLGYWEKIGMTRVSISYVYPS